MCRNHSHAEVVEDWGMTLHDGTVVHIAALLRPTFTLDVEPTGEKLIVPRCTMLLLLSPERGMDSYTHEALMAALSALSSVLARNENDFGVQIRPSLKLVSPS